MLIDAHKADDCNGDKAASKAMDCAVFDAGSLGAGKSIVKNALAIDPGALLRKSLGRLDKCCFNESMKGKGELGFRGEGNKDRRKRTWEGLGGGFATSVVVRNLAKLFKNFIFASG